MEYDYWQKQASDKPLFPDLLWSRPENKRLAGKLLIIGGGASGFSAVAESYNAALSAGIGVARVILPSSLKKTVSQVFPEAEFAPNNASTSFASKALAALVDASGWADGVLLAGDFGKNSETQIMLERFVYKYSGALTLAGDSLNYFMVQPDNLLARRQTILAPSFGQLQKLAAACGVAITSQLGLLQLVERLHELTQASGASIITTTNDQILVAASGQVSTTTLASGSKAKLAASAAVWSLQNPGQSFKALTSAGFEVCKK